MARLVAMSTGPLIELDAFQPEAGAPPAEGAPSPEPVEGLSLRDVARVALRWLCGVVRAADAEPADHRVPRDTRGLRAGAERGAHEAGAADRGRELGGEGEAVSHRAHRGRGRRLRCGRTSSSGGGSHRSSAAQVR